VVAHVPTEQLFLAMTVVGMGNRSRCTWVTSDEGKNIVQNVVRSTREYLNDLSGSWSNPSADCFARKAGRAHFLASRLSSAIHSIDFLRFFSHQGPTLVLGRGCIAEPAFGVALF